MDFQRAQAWFDIAQKVDALGEAAEGPHGLVRIEPPPPASL